MKIKIFLACLVLAGCSNKNTLDNNWVCKEIGTYYEDRTMIAGRVSMVTKELTTGCISYTRMNVKEHLHEN